jgi:hypothetical protein
MAARLSCSGCRYWLAAMGAAAGVDRNLAQAFRALLRGWVRWGRRLTHARDQSVNRRDNEEVHRSSDQQERDYGVHEVSDRENRIVDCEADGREVRLPENGGDEGSEQVFG